MKHTTAKNVLFTLTLLSSALVNATEWSGNVGVYLGQKTLDDTDWANHDEQGSIAMILDVQQQDWPVSMAVDLFGTGDETKQSGNKRESYTAEAHLGLRKVFQLPIENCKLRPYVGGGVALIHAEEKETVNGNSTSYDDSATGYWVGAGTYFKVTEQLNLGLDVRYSAAEVSLNDAEKEAGGTMLSLGVGYHW